MSNLISIPFLKLPSTIAPPYSLISTKTPIVTLGWLNYNFVLLFPKAASVFANHVKISADVLEEQKLTNLRKFFAINWVDNVNDGGCKNLGILSRYCMEVNTYFYPKWNQKIGR